MHTDKKEELKEQLILEIERRMLKSLSEEVYFNTYTFLVNAYKNETTHEEVLHISLVLVRNENISQRE